MTSGRMFSAEVQVFSSRTNAGLILRWKSLTEPLFGTSENKDNKGTNNRTKGRNKGLGDLDNKNGNNLDSTKTTIDSLVTASDNKPPVLLRAFTLLKLTVKALFFDYDNFTFNFSNNNSLSKSGLLNTGSGFTNFWGHFI